MEEIDARPDIIPVAKVTPPLCEGSDRSDSRCPTTESFDWNDQVERGRREIEFSSFPPGILSFQFLSNLFFFLFFYVATRAVSSIVLSYDDCVR